MVSSAGMVVLQLIQPSHILLDPRSLPSEMETASSYNPEARGRTNINYSFFNNRSNNGKHPLSTNLPLDPYRPNPKEYFYKLPLAAPEAWGILAV